MLAEFPIPNSRYQALLALATAWIVLISSAIFLWHKQPFYRTTMHQHHITDRIVKWCTETPSVSDKLAEDPKLSPEKASDSLFGTKHPGVIDKSPPKERERATAEDLEKAYRCGKFGETRPSELFLRIYHDSLLPMEQEPLIGCVSPCLTGSSGAIPLTIIGPLPDIIRHMVSTSSAVFNPLLMID